MAGALPVVLAVVPDLGDRAAFDDWYGCEHLPDATKAFSAQSTWRGWSKTNPSAHYAYPRFGTLDHLEAILTGPEIKALIAEFDRCWMDRVTRTREVIAVSDASGGQ